MCGIAGIVWKDRQRPADSAMVDRMCRLLWHRGPDDGGSFLQGNVGLGHRRLAILDLSPAGRQPMHPRDGRLTVVFNGEIYNYLELREELQKSGAQFKTQTDTEVLLEAYRRWGADCVQRFNGMWAFAIFDADDGTIFLSRDRVGIKPLYYSSDSEAFVFASEIKAIAGVRPAVRRANRPYLVQFLRTGLRDGGTETAFENVHSLPAGHNAVYDTRRGRFEVFRYWSLNSDSAERTPVDQAAARLQELLQSSIRLRLRSDVPVGSCLSGGIDSSTIVGIAASQRTEPIYTFSGLYSDRDANEEEFVNAVNRHVNTVGRPVRPQPHGDLIDDLRTIVWHQDEPAASPGLYTQYHVMRTARRDVTVILDGQGGDELFAGYLFDFTHRVRDLIRENPLTGRLRALPLLLSMTRHWGLKTAAQGWNAFFAGGLNWLRRFIRRPRSADVNLLHPQWQHKAIRSTSANETFHGGSLLVDSLHRQVTETSLPTLLHFEDRNSMAYSLEARVPLLDHRIVEFAAALDANAKIHRSWTKWCLRKVAERFVPAAVAWRRSKMGYPTPMDRWLREPAERDNVADVLFSSHALGRDLFDEQRLRTLWAEHQRGVDHGWLLFRVLTTNLWFKQSIDAWQPCPAIPVSPSQRTSTSSEPAAA